MAFQVQFDNLGKLTGAPVLVRPFTVLAGPNNTGKSFFSKSLYSVFEAMHTNHALIQIQRMVEPLRDNLTNLETFGFESAQLETLGGHLKQLEDLCLPLSGEADEIAAVKDIYPHLAKAAEDCVGAYKALHSDLEKFVESDHHPFFDEDSLKEMETRIEEVGQIPKRTPEEIVLFGFGEALERNLIGNFQVPTLANLKKDAKQDTSLTILEEGEGGAQVGRIEIKSNALNFQIEGAGLIRLKKFSRVIYLESPIHWKLRGALRMARAYSEEFFGRSRRRLLNIPKYFRDLDRALDEDSSGDPAFPEALRRLTEDVMRGKVMLAKSGELVFKEFDQGVFNLPMTSTGVVNLGILALLIERKIIDKGSFIFIDEPESNLHPQWHEEMVRALFDLARDGVNVVIATHSVNILKWIEVHVKKKPADKGLIALNQFSDKGVVNGGKGFTDKLDDIMIELTHPFHLLRQKEF